MPVILALDPGTKRTGFALYDVPEISESRMYEGEIKRFGILPNEEMLEALQELLNYSDIVAIEMIAHYGLGMAVGREVFQTCVWIGRFWQLVHSETSNEGTGLDAPDVDLQLIFRVNVKRLLCGTHKAKDANIRQALIDNLGAPGTKKSPGKTYGIAGDAWQALGVAVTCAAGLGRNGFDDEKT